MARVEALVDDEVVQREAMGASLGYRMFQSFEAANPSESKSLVT